MIVDQQGTGEAPPWVCATCGNSYPGDREPPEVCRICADDRQWVPPDGQRWTTLAELVRAGHRSDVREVEPGLLGIGAKPPFAIGQRALLVTTPEGNLLWDPPGFLDDAAIQRVAAAGGVTAVSASHPHFYGTGVDWSRAFDAEVLLPEVDAGWLARPARRLRTWEGSLEVLPGVTLVQCGGHFPGSAVVHWEEGAEGRGALLTGDTIFVTPGEDRVSFLWSAPNRLPLPERAVHGIVDAIAPYPFDRIYGGWWKPVIRTDARRVVDASVQHYLRVLRGER